MVNPERVGIEFFNRPVDEVARALIGASLLFRAASGIAGGVVVEAEAYEQGDPASHTKYKSRKMSASMYLCAGHIYVYPKSKRSELCHLNLVCGPYNYGSAVLIRALEPLEESKQVMRVRRTPQKPAAKTNDLLLCNGPNNLCQALDITSDLDGKSLDEVPLELYNRKATPEIWWGPRIGVTEDPDWIASCIVPPRRYALAGSPFVSHRNRKRYPLRPIPGGELGISRSPLGGA